LEENSGMKPMKQTITKQWIFALLLCGLLSTALPAADPVPFSHITPAQAAALIKAKSADPLFVILDVRTPKEFALNRIKGARNIDIKAPDARERFAKLDKNGTYLVYCRMGPRSSRAMQGMKKMGFKRVFNLAGGLMRWQQEKLPMEGKPLKAGPTAK
jgi:rhodanese-related sulfurtransferase